MRLDKKTVLKVSGVSVIALLLGLSSITIDNTRMIVLYLSSYLLFQVIAGIIIFNKLMKKY